jgi:hypothetical protein
VPGVERATRQRIAELILAFRLLMSNFRSIDRQLSRLQFKVALPADQVIDECYRITHEFCRELSLCRSHMGVVPRFRPKLPPSKARTIDRPNEFQIRGWPD